MKLLICIDDTDNLESKGTGAIAQEIAELIKNRGLGECGIITRHQLLLHEDIPYTSHNSSMCFDCETDKKNYNQIVEIATEYLKAESAEGSDPGICITKINEGLNGKLLLDFGLRAKKIVLTKKEAYDLADSAKVYLKEVGGTGQGVIGAVAGIGLRLGGNDGEVKGEIKQFLKGESYAVKQLKEESIIRQVVDENLMQLDDNEKIYVEWKAKPMLTGGVVTLIVHWLEDRKIWTTMDKKRMRAYGNNRIYLEGCEAFSPDVMEEQVTESKRSCLNCRYRRWTNESLLCIVENK